MWCEFTSLQIEHLIEKIITLKNLNHETMKRLLLACCLLVSFSCTKDPSETGGKMGQNEAVVVGTPSLAAKGTLAVKLTPEAAQSVEQAKTRGGEATRSGIGDIDAILDEIGANNFERVIEYNAQWEALYTETGLNRWYSITFDDDVALERVGKLFAEHPEVAVVEYAIDPCHRKPMREGPVRPLTAASAQSMGVLTRASRPMNDPFLPNQWHYENSGPAGYEEFLTPPAAGADINLYDAWQLCTGGPEVIVAVLDEPVQTTHPDLQANIWTNPKNANEHGYNFWNKSPDLDWKSSEYNSTYQEWEYADHGSHVAGVIAAVNNNSRGVCGVAGGNNGGGVKIMSCQIMGYSDKTVDYYADTKAFNYAMINGAIVAQNSWGYDITDKQWNEVGTTQFSMVRDAIKTFIKGAGSNNPASPLKGGIVLFAAGNDGPSNAGAKTWPSAYDPVIAVGSMDWRFKPAYYTDYGTWVDITAPGGDVFTGLIPGDPDPYADGQILSTILCDDAIDFKDGRKNDKSFYGYGFMQGTSMACPHVSGVAALGLAYAAQLGKQFTTEQYTALLLSSVYGIDSYFTGSKRGNGFTISDLTIYRNKMGGGCVDALKLLLAIKGTPAIYVKMGAATTIDFAPYFGGAQSKVKLLSAVATDITKLGLSAVPSISGTQMIFNCTKPGTTMLTITAKAGDTTFTREFAIVSRAGLATNGGWL